MNWPVEPESLNWGPRYIQERYGLPMFIAEKRLILHRQNLSGRLGCITWSELIFWRAILEKLSGGIQAGADVRRYFHWSLLDNYEWHNTRPKRSLYPLCHS